jgi:Putative Flp pilus-assembly TadE/G-like
VNPARPTTRARRDERGSISLFILGLSLIAMLLIAGTVAVTSAHLSRMRLLDVADGAALSAANALDDSAYDRGVGESVPLSNRSVQERAATYLTSRPRPASTGRWRLGPGTGTPDGRTAVVVVVGEARLPMIGPALRELGVSVTITVESRARADVLG